MIAIWIPVNRRSVPQQCWQGASVHLVEVHQVLQPGKLGLCSVQREGIFPVMRYLHDKKLLYRCLPQSLSVSSCYNSLRAVWMSASAYPHYLRVHDLPVGCEGQDVVADLAAARADDEHAVRVSEGGKVESCGTFNWSRGVNVQAGHVHCPSVQVSMLSCHLWGKSAEFACSRPMLGLNQAAPAPAPRSVLGSAPAPPSVSRLDLEEARAGLARPPQDLMVVLEPSLAITAASAGSEIIRPPLPAEKSMAAWCACSRSWVIQ